MKFRISKRFKTNEVDNIPYILNFIRTIYSKFDKVECMWLSVSIIFDQWTLGDVCCHTLDEVSSLLNQTGHCFGVEFIGEKLNIQHNEEDLF